MKNIEDAQRKILILNSINYNLKNSHVKYKNYDHTTQIVALPGGQKRDKYSIKDDQKFKNKKNPGHIVKMMRDYNSTIVCLPNTQVRNLQSNNIL